ncbi:MAG: BON domain-containing protein [Desulfobacula sp.]|nr:BON domain-containing protein [Desulfobacula sp.]
MNFRYFLLSCLFTICFMLAGCGAVLVGGAAYGGYKGATDQRSMGTMMDDSVISTKVKARMIDDEFVKAGNIDVDVLNGIVYLIGVVKSSSQKRMAADIARGVEGVNKVENQLLVGKTSIGQDFDDTMLTSKIKVKLLQDFDIRSTNIDVDTYNNVITLTGIVRTHEEQNKVIYVVQKIAGNRQIVNNLSVGR